MPTFRKRADDAIASLAEKAGVSIKLLVNCKAAGTTSGLPPHVARAAGIQQKEPGLMVMRHTRPRYTPLSQ